MRTIATAALVVILGGLAPAPGALAQSSGPVVAVAPSCVVPGVATQVVIWGASWPAGQVVLRRRSGRVFTPVGTAESRTSPRGRPGTFTLTTTVAADEPFQIVASQPDISAVSNPVAAAPACPPQITVAPTCLRGPGKVTVNGTGFAPGAVGVIADPFGAAESEVQTADASTAGAFSLVLDVPFAGGTVPIIATQFSGISTVSLPPTRAVAFVGPCPPDPPRTTTSTTRPPPGTTTTTGADPGTTTTATTVPAPGIPPVTVPTPGATAQVTISPRTVRPGRCNVIVVSAAPPGLPVVARYVDAPPVSGQTDPGGGTVLSICHPHDSGVPLGPVQVLIGIGPMAPMPVFTVLRVPPRPQPPLLQSGGDSRRS